jgi:hypothetical protein
MKLAAIAALSILTMACASAPAETPAPAAPVQAQAPAAVANDVSIYTGTYELQAPSRVLEVRIFQDQEGKLSGELVSSGQRTVMRATDTPHKFLHETRDDIWFLFKIENGRSTELTMHQAGRQISGPRTK